MMRSQTDEQLAARHDPTPYVGRSGKRRANPFEDGGEPAFLDPRVEMADSPCQLCLGTGRVAYGPWGSRPPRKVCPACGGSALRPPVNRVLAFLREWIIEYDVSGIPTSDFWMEDRGRWVDGATPEMIDHARKVLTRLAKLADTPTMKEN